MMYEKAWTGVMDMANKLRNLRLTKVDLVDEGANPDANIMFAKRKDAADDADDRVDMNLLGRIAKALESVFGTERVAKEDAKTFSQMENFQAAIDQIYEMNWAMTGSLTSILRDDELDPDERLKLMQDSLSQYTAALTAAIPMWATGNTAQITKRLLPELDMDELVKQRDSMSVIIGKSADPDPNDDPEPDDDDKDENDEDEADKKAPIGKGKDDRDMKFDVDKMNAEERTLYEDLAKRFGAEDNGQSAVDGAVVKGLQDQNKELADVVAKLRDTIETNELSGIAKGYELLGKKAEDLLPVLKKMKAAGQEVFDAYLAGLNEQKALVEKSGIFSEIGKRGDDVPSDAWAQIEAQADEIMKSKPGTSRAAAIVEVGKQHPELIEQYEKSRG